MRRREPSDQQCPDQWEPSLPLTSGVLTNKRPRLGDWPMALASGQCKDTSRDFLSIWPADPLGPTHTHTGPHRHTHTLGPTDTRWAPENYTHTHNAMMGAKFYGALALYIVPSISELVLAGRNVFFCSKISLSLSQKHAVLKIWYTIVLISIWNLSVF